MLNNALLKLAGVAVATVLAGAVAAQQSPMPSGQMQHHHTIQQPGPGIPSLPGQDAFGAIQEIVRILQSDPNTDWTKVDLERLRQHLIDMNDVTLHSSVKAENIPGGLSMDVTGVGRTGQAIRRMVGPHTNELNAMPEWSARTEDIPEGLRLIVTARRPDDTQTIARIRGLGFIGLLVQGAHHQPHHLAMARGDAAYDHGR